MTAWRNGVLNGWNGAMLAKYRVRSTHQDIIWYHGVSFINASLIFDSAKGSRTLERQVAGEWRDVYTYQQGGD